MQENSDHDIRLDMSLESPPLFSFINFRTLILSLPLC
nr:MAG TPA: hypothetical protein [Caudoviricetes sp.]DAS43582.1 MAG TPA: hypothetical protein [Caudoviricetes sp.]